MSYTQKNNPKLQLEFLDRFIKLYGINGIGDTETEIKCSDLSRFDEMSALVPEMKGLFKISTMNLKRTNDEITSANAITVLKQLCMQANILIEKTKYSGYCTYALVAENPLISIYRSQHLVTTTKSPKKSKPFSYFNSLKCKHNPNILVTNTVKKKCIEAGGDLMEDTINYIDNRQPFLMCCFITCILPETRAATWDNIKFDCIDVRYTVNDEQYISIPLYGNDEHSADIIQRITEAVLYDKEGKKFLPDRMTLSKNAIGHVTDISLGDINFPSFALKKKNGYCINLYYSNIVPYYYKLRTDCKILWTSEMKIKCENWGNYPIKNGELVTEQFNYINTNVTIDVDRTKISNYTIQDNEGILSNMLLPTKPSEIYIPRRAGAICSVTSSCDIKIKLGLYEISTNNDIIPLITIVEPTVICEDSKFSISFKYCDFDSDAPLVLDGDDYEQPSYLSILTKKSDNLPL